MASPSIRPAGLADLDELLPLIRGYCEFYKSSPRDDDLRRLARALIDDPDREGIQVLARDPDGRAVAFARLYGAGPPPRPAGSPS